MLDNLKTDNFIMFPSWKIPFKIFFVVIGMVFLYPLFIVTGNVNDGVM